MDDVIMARDMKKIESLGEREFTRTEIGLIQRIYDDNIYDDSVPSDYEFDDYTHVLSKLNYEFLMEVKARFRNDSAKLEEIQKVYEELKSSGEFNAPTKEAVLAFNSAFAKRLGITIDESPRHKDES